MNINQDPIIIVLDSIIRIIKVSSICAYVRYTGEKRRKLTEKTTKKIIKMIGKEDYATNNTKKHNQ